MPLAVVGGATDVVSPPSVAKWARFAPFRPDLSYWHLICGL